MASGALAVTSLQCSADGGGSGSGPGTFASGGSAAASSGGAASGGTSSGGSSSGGNAGSGFGGSIIDANTKDYSAEDFFLDDPPPMSCDGGGQPPAPGGTPECPSDKNLPGCVCTAEGEMAPCWPGYRRNRNRGACADGMTVCEKVGESLLQWGDCVGYSGINPDTFEPLGTTGAAACTCFSGGRWELVNLSPCFYSDAGDNIVGAVSTIPTDDMGGARCPTENEFSFDTGTPPSQPFTNNTITVDCTGFFKLCYTYKALSAPEAERMPMTDCVMKQICTESYYGTKDEALQMPPLPGWVTATPQETACAQAFVANGGYAEMSVVGETDECDIVDKIFNTVTYCPLECNTNPSLPGCENCGNGGGGSFDHEYPDK